MDPFDEYRDRRRGKNPFDFIDDDEFERIFDKMQRMFESTNFREMIKEMLQEDFGSNKRFIHGFKINIGHDGKPKIQEFGNCPLKKPQREPMISEEYEPLADITEGDEEVAVTVEIPGVENKDIDLNVNADTLEITVNNPRRKYHKLLDLPCDVKPKTMKATYKNGVLDVVIKRKKKKKTSGRYRATIE